MLKLRGGGERKLEWKLKALGRLCLYLCVFVAVWNWPKYLNLFPYKIRMTGNFPHEVVSKTKSDNIRKVFNM